MTGDVIHHRKDPAIGVGSGADVVRHLVQTGEGAGIGNAAAETLQEYPIKVVHSHPFEMSQAGLGIIGRVKPSGSATRISHTGREKLVGIEFGNIRPEINRRVGGNRVLAAKPMNPTATGGTIAGTAEPS